MLERIKTNLSEQLQQPGKPHLGKCFKEIRGQTLKQFKLAVKNIEHGTSKGRKKLRNKKPRSDSQKQLLYILVHCQV